MMQITSQNKYSLCLFILLSFLLISFCVINFFAINVDKKPYREYHINAEYHIKVRFEPEEKKLFCLIKTTPEALRTNKTLTVYNVWASRCSNYRFVTLIPSDQLDFAIDYDGHKEISTPFYLLQPEGLKVHII